MAQSFQGERPVVLSWASTTSQTPTTTIAADADEFWVVKQVTCSLTGAPTTDVRLRITIGGTVMWEAFYDVSESAHTRPYTFLFPDGLCKSPFTKSEALVVGFNADPGAGSHTISVGYY
jgi:hypothetical protein